MLPVTEQLLSGSLVFTVIMLLISFAFQIYVLFLNYKQSKVNNQMTELISEVKKINKQLKKLEKQKK
jgi:membrane protein insertase Oxa1/YidC/SpoIIIJ